jgi:putative peptidoglycan lipid II flippase
VAAADDNGFARTSSVSTRAVVLVTLVAAAALAAAADPIARVLAQHGPAATHGDLVSLGHAIAAFAPGLVGYGLVAHLGRALYAKHAGRFAAVAIVIGWLAVIVADLVLVASLSRANAVPALALGNSIGMTISGVLLIVGMTRVAPRAMDQLASTVVLGLIAAAIGALCGRGVADLTASAGVAASVGSGVLAVAVTASSFAMVLLLVSRRRVRSLLVEIR